MEINSEQLNIYYGNNKKIIIIKLKITSYVLLIKLKRVKIK